MGFLPRLTRFWTHLSRQRGSTGSIGGEGESQLESDRRRTKERMEKLTEELREVQRQRATQRAGRQRHQWPMASIVGYTNAGKSTLLNALAAHRGALLLLWLRAWAPCPSAPTVQAAYAFLRLFVATLA